MFGETNLKQYFHKKFMFSAIAMMAFSFSTIANTIEKEISLFLDEEIMLTDCYREATQVSNALTAVLELSEAESYQAFATAYDNCVRSGRCSNCLEGN